MNLASTAMADGRMAAFPDRRTKTLILPACIVALSYLLLVWFGASGVRGEDEYWYVADVQSLISGNGVQTNEIYPVSVRRAPAPLPRPFVHNILNVYVAAIAATLVGAYAGWIVTNVIAGFLTAFLIYRTVILFTQPTAAVVACLTYLLLPLTFWLTVQPLADATFAPLVALTVLVYVTAKTDYWRWMLLATLAGLLLLCRENFLLLVLAVPVAYLVRVRGRLSAALVGAGGLLLIGFAFWLLKERFFEPNVAPTYGQVLLYKTPQLPMMKNWFDLSGQELALADLLPKAVRELSAQFFHFDLVFLVFYLPFNLILLVFLFFAYRSRRMAAVDVAVAAGFYVLFHLITVIVVVNQMRYLLIATPPLLVAAGIALGSSRWFQTARISVAGAAIGVMIAAIPSIAMSWESHTEGIRDQEIRENLAAAFNQTLPAGDTVMVVLDLTRGFREQMLGYVLRPRPVLYASDRYGADDYAALIKNVNAKWLMSRRDSPVYSRWPWGKPRELRQLPTPFADWSLYSIDGEGVPLQKKAAASGD